MYSLAMLNPGTKITEKLSQKPAYEVNAQAPNVFPRAKSHIPATKSAIPPYAKANRCQSSAETAYRVQLLYSGYGREQRQG